MAMQNVPHMDQGYAWVVTFACFVVSFIMAGLARAAGVLYVAVIELYGISRETASAPFNVRFSVRNMSGPLVGVLGQRYGIRAITMTGGLLAGIGGALCALAPDVFWLTVFWGGVHGIGYGLCNLIHVMILNQYFDKYKGSALGLALSGDCFGTFAFPIILELLLQNYGVNGTFLILGGIALNVIPAGLLMRTPYWEERHSEKKTTKISSECENYPKEGYLSGVLNKAFESNFNNFSNKDFRENSHLTSYLQINDTMRIANYHLAKKLMIKTSTDEANVSYLENMKNSSPPFSNNLLPLNVITSKLCIQDPNTNKLQEPYLSKVSYLSSLMEANNDCLELGRNSEKMRCDPEVNIIIKESQHGNAKEPNALVQYFITNSRPLFILIAITLSAFQYLFLALITIIIDYARDVGISSEGAKYLVIGFSVADLIGRLGFGVVLDKQWIKSSHFAGLTTVVMGASFLAIPVCSNFYYVMACMSLCGLVMGGNCIMYPILVEKYMEKKEQSMALGSMNMYGGLMMFSLSPMIGFFRDTMGSYDGVFWVVGIFCTLMGFLWLLEPHLWRMQQRMVKNNST